MGKAKCLWSDTRDGVSLDDIRESYYGFRVIESRIWIGGVGGLSVVVK